jgi:hypothetical protein
MTWNELEVAALACTSWERAEELHRALMNHPEGWVACPQRVSTILGYWRFPVRHQAKWGAPLIERVRFVTIDIEPLGGKLNLRCRGIPKPGRRCAPFQQATELTNGPAIDPDELPWWRAFWAARGVQIMPFLEWRDHAWATGEDNKPSWDFSLTRCTSSV